ncbi:hypothetical protein ABZ532_10475 [Streptomyces sp. NPDC019396]|uniref:hypothetical protein n=1 Tax=Streptomyces sp. NPDC019396 TaxID=3154687 RepID=UPI0033DE55F5
MDLRPELLPPPVSQQRLDELSTEIDRVADLVADRSEDAEEAIRAFNAMTGHEYVAYDFAEYYGRRSAAEFAREAARPPCPGVEDITRGELVEIVGRVIAGDLESDYYLRLLEANVTHPRVSDLVFQASAGSVSAAEIVEEALQYQPIAL